MRRFLFLWLWLLCCTSPLVAQPTEEAVAVERDFGRLYGTLLAPAENPSQSVVLIIAGSGPTDRNGNSTMNIGGDSYRLLANGLAEAGFASLRYDKRAIGQSIIDPEAIPDLTLEEYIADAVALAEWLSGKGYRRVFLAGHSEGALIALLAAQRTEAVAGVISLTGAAYPIDEILRLQLAGQLALTHPALLMEAEGIIAQLKRGERVDMSTHSRELLSLFHASVQPFLISQMHYDPRAEVRKVGCPLLIIGGDNDLQVSAENAQALAEARFGLKPVILQGMTHLLKYSDKHTLAEQLQSVYRDPTIPLHEELLPTIIKFLNHPTKNSNN